MAADDEVGIGVAVGIAKEPAVLVNEHVDEPLALAVLLELAHRAPLLGGERELDDVVVAAGVVGDHGRLRSHEASAKASTMSPTATVPITTVINTGSRRPATNMLKAEVGMRAGSDGSRVKSCRPVRYQRRVGARLSISGATGEPF